MKLTLASQQVDLFYPISEKTQLQFLRYQNNCTPVFSPVHVSFVHLIFNFVIKKYYFDTTDTKKKRKTKQNKKCFCTFDFMLKNGKLKTATYRNWFWTFRLTLIWVTKKSKCWKKKKKRSTSRTKMEHNDRSIHTLFYPFVYTLFQCHTEVVLFENITKETAMFSLTCLLRSFVFMMLRWIKQVRL